MYTCTVLYWLIDCCLHFCIFIYTKIQFDLNPCCHFAVFWSTFKGLASDHQPGQRICGCRRIHWIIIVKHGRYWWILLIYPYPMNIHPQNQSPKYSLSLKSSREYGRAWDSYIVSQGYIHITSYNYRCHSQTYSHPKSLLWAVAPAISHLPGAARCWVSWVSWGRQLHMAHQKHPRAEGCNAIEMPTRVKQWSFSFQLGCSNLGVMYFRVSYLFTHADKWHIGQANSYEQPRQWIHSAQACKSGHENTKTNSGPQICLERLAFLRCLFSDGPFVPHTWRSESHAKQPRFPANSPPASFDLRPLQCRKLAVCLFLASAKPAILGGESPKVMLTIPPNASNQPSMAINNPGVSLHQNNLWPPLTHLWFFKLLWSAAIWRFP